MRPALTKEKLLELLKRLGAASKTPGRCYLTGGATALLNDWRQTTIDVDLKFSPEPTGVFEVIPALKNELQINIELAAPDDFIPIPKGWEDRSKLILQQGQLSFFHFDYLSQALAKIERGLEQDLGDVKQMLANKLLTADEISDGFAAIKDNLIRYPAIDAKDFEDKVTQFLRTL
jgi:hypothetical protein